MKPKHRQAVIWSVAVAGLALGVVSIARWLDDAGALERELRERTLIDAETGAVFHDHPVPTGAPLPLTHPSTGRATLYPAERCHWTAEGAAKLEPTYVLLNTYRGSDEPTVCPDCGREVVAYNPLPPHELMIEAAQREGG